jgi:hypothetical protein
MDNVNWAALAPFLVLLLAFVIWCWVDMSRHEVRYLPRWLWAVIVGVSVPLGGVVYLLVGRESSPVR